VFQSSAALDLDDNDPLDDWDEHLNRQISSELDDYLGEALAPRKDNFDILDWWMKHTTQYPHTGSYCAGRLSYAGINRPV
jgi:hypothetical protein